MDQAEGFIPWSIHKGDIPLSKTNMQKIDSVLAQLALSIDSVRSIQTAIARAQLIVPALSNRLEKVKSLLEGEKRQHSHYRAKCKEEGTTLMCDTALAVVGDAHNQMLFIMRECSALMVDSDVAAITAGFSPEVNSKLYSILGM